MSDFLAFNKSVLSDERLPAFDPKMQMACLSKNHLVTALRLFKGAFHTGARPPCIPPVVTTQASWTHRVFEDPCVAVSCAAPYHVSTLRTVRASA